MSACEPVAVFSLVRTLYIDIPPPGKQPGITFGPSMQLVLKNLTCERAGRQLFPGISRTLKNGEGLLVTGPNGSGKTTLIKTITGLLRPLEGSIRLTGGTDGAPLAERCHLIGHADGVKRALSVKENLDFWSAYLGGTGSARALERLGLEALADLPAGVLSAGQRRRLALTRLLAAPRPLWLLDEPAEALDRASKTLLADMIKDHMGTGGIVLAVSHSALGCKFSQSLELKPPATGRAAR